MVLRNPKISPLSFGCKALKKCRSLMGRFSWQSESYKSNFKPKREVTYRFFGSCKSRFRLQLLLLYALNLCIDMPKILNAEVCLLNSLDGLQRQASPISDASKTVKMLAVKMLLKLRLLYQHYARCTPMENSR